MKKGDYNLNKIKMIGIIENNTHFRDILFFLERVCTYFFLIVPS